jgi:hypothetical protein
MAARHFRPAPAVNRGIEIAARGDLKSGWVRLQIEVQLRPIAREDAQMAQRRTSIDEWRYPATAARIPEEQRKEPGIGAHAVLVSEIDRAAAAAHRQPSCLVYVKSFIERAA